MVEYAQCLVKILKGTVVLLIAVLAAQIAAMRDVPLEYEICVVEGVHVQNDALPPLPQPPPLEQLEQPPPPLEPESDGGR